MTLDPLSFGARTDAPAIQWRTAGKGAHRRVDGLHDSAN